MACPRRLAFSKVGGSEPLSSRESQPAGASHPSLPVIVLRFDAAWQSRQLALLSPVSPLENQSRGGKPPFPACYCAEVRRRRYALAFHTGSNVSRISVVLTSVLAQASTVLISSVTRTLCCLPSSTSSISVVALCTPSTSILATPRLRPCGFSTIRL